MHKNIHSTTAPVRTPGAPGKGNRGYRGHGVDKTQVLINGTRRGLTPALTPALAADLRRRAAIEPEIGHMETDGRLARSPLKGMIGDALFAVLCGCGHNIRKILAWLRTVLTHLIALCISVLRRDEGRNYIAEAA